jgi:hypothetical protein
LHLCRGENRVTCRVTSTFFVRAVSPGVKVSESREESTGVTEVNLQRAERGGHLDTFIAVANRSRLIDTSVSYDELRVAATLSLRHKQRTFNLIIGNAGFDREYSEDTGLSLASPIISGGYSLCEFRYLVEHWLLCDWPFHEIRITERPVQVHYMCMTLAEPSSLK